MSSSMRWNDTVKASALTALAERTTTAAPTTINTRWNWDANEVWLSRVRPPRDLAARSLMGEPSNPPCQDIAARR